MSEQFEKVSKKNTRDDSDLLSSDDVSGMLGVTNNTLGIWRHQGVGPRYLRLSRRAIRYRKQDVLDWMEETVIETK